MYFYHNYFTILTIIVIIKAAPVKQSEQLFKLLILHNNDMHARFEETSRNSGTCAEKDRNKNCYGGFARTANRIRFYRQLEADGKIENVLYLNAGDTFTGTSWYTVFKWQIAGEFINALKPDAVVLGNHEFDDGVAGLAPFVDMLNSPMLAANLDFSNEPKLKSVNKSIIVEKSGHKIGIIGYLTPDTKIMSSPGETIFNDEIEAVRLESEKLDRLGVKIIIALGHSGYLMDQKIAAEVPLIDVVVGGHSNTFLWNGPQPDLEPVDDPYPNIIRQKSGKTVPVVQAFAYTKYLGRLNLTFSENGDLIDFEGQPLLLDPSIAQDKDVLDLVEKYRPQIDELSKKVIGQTRVILDGNSTKCRYYECNFGNFISDAFVFYVASVSASNYWTTYPICLVNGGSIRNSINEGPITRSDLLAVQPFGNQIISLTMKGSDLLQTLEIGVRGNGDTSGGEFLQMSGMHVVYDRSKPVGSRVVYAEARCGQCDIPIYEPINPDKFYNIITTTFLISGGDGHYLIKNNSFNHSIQDLSDVDALEWYIDKQGVVYPEEQGRIQYLQQELHNLVSSGTNRKVLSFHSLSISLFLILLICT